VNQDLRSFWQVLYVVNKGERRVQDAETRSVAHFEVEIAVLAFESVFYLMGDEIDDVSDPIQFQEFLLLRCFRVFKVKGEAYLTRRWSRSLEKTRIRTCCWMA